MSEDDGVKSKWIIGMDNTYFYELIKKRNIFLLAYFKKHEG